MNYFNEKNRWKKRGIAVVPMQWPMVYDAYVSAFVAIFHGDGSVAVTHGGIEMGQGINTKVAQVAAFTLGVPLNLVTVTPNNNIVTANSTFTAKSSTSEMACFVSTFYIVSLCISKYNARYYMYRR